MKKNNFLEGSFIATFGIIICKIIGLLYVIPFYAMITNMGASLYSYAYSIYSVFLSLSTSGIPFAMSKLVSEYNALEYYNTKERVYKIGMKIIAALGIFFFFVLFITAPYIASFILGKTTGGNTPGDITLVIRTVSVALLIVPFLSVAKGYLQGHKYITPASVSNIIEQLVRVIIIIAGCFISLKLMGIEERYAIATSVLAAAIGALFAYIYLIIKIYKNKDKLHRHEKITRHETKYTNRYLLKQIIYCAVPFIIVDVLKSAYNLVDTLTVVRTLTDLGYSNTIAETTFSIIGTWGSKLSMIIISISMGISISLIPNIAESYVKKNKSEVELRTNQAIQTLMFLVIPMTIGIFFLARPIWILFYEYNPFSFQVFRMFIIQSITFSLISILINIIQTTNHTKTAITVLFLSFLANALLNIPMMHFCHNIGFGGYQGASVATLITQIIPCIYLLYYIKRKFQINYKAAKINCTKIVLITAIMIISLMIISLFYPINSTNRMEALIETIVYSIIGGIIYFILSYKSGLFHSLFGNRFSIFHKKKTS